MHCSLITQPPIPRLTCAPCLQTRLAAWPRKSASMTTPPRRAAHVWIGMYMLALLTCPCVLATTVTCASLNKTQCHALYGLCYYDVRRSVCGSGMFMLQPIALTYFFAALVSSSCSCSNDPSSATDINYCTASNWTSPSSATPDRLYAVTETFTTANTSLSPLIAGKYGCYLNKSSNCPCNYDSQLYASRTYRMCSVGKLLEFIRPCIDSTLFRLSLSANIRPVGYSSRGKRSLH